MKTKKRVFVLIVSIFGLTLVLAGCQNAGTDTPSNTDAPVATVSSGTITLDGTSITSQSDGVQVDGTTATIHAPGTYTITGTLNDGQIVVNTTGNVTLVLENANLTCMTSAPIYVQDAGNITLTLADGSSNTITDGAAYTFAGTETEPDAAIFSTADMVMNGNGALTVNANYHDGIASRDTLLIQSGRISVIAKTHGIKGKDYLLINGGNIHVTAGGDGIKATNDMQVSLGFVEIGGGELNITATDDGISAISLVTIKGGTIGIDTENNGIKSDNVIDLQGGTIDIQTDDDALVSLVTQTGSTTATLTVNGEAVPLG